MQGIVLNEKWNKMERKFRYGIWKMPEWNGRFQEWNKTQSSILPYQFHARFLSSSLFIARFSVRVAGDVTS